MLPNHEGNAHVDNIFPHVQEWLYRVNDIIVGDALRGHSAAFMMCSLTFDRDAVDAFRGVLKRASTQTYWGVSNVTLDYPAGHGYELREVSLQVTSFYNPSLPRRMQHSAF